MDHVSYGLAHTGQNFQTAKHLIAYPMRPSLNQPGLRISESTLTRGPRAKHGE